MDALRKELVAARKRLQGQEALLQMSEQVLADAQKSGMVAVAQVALARVTRQMDAVRQTKSVIAELEKATGALPLENATKRK